MPYTIGSRNLTNAGEIQLSVLREAAKELNKHREDNGLEKINARGRDRNTLYNFLKDYIEFKSEDGNEYVLRSGRGEPLTEIVAQVEPTVEFNDVKNDPYFVVK